MYLRSGQINIISKEIIPVERVYMNIHPPPPLLKRWLRPWVRSINIGQNITAMKLLYFLHTISFSYFSNVLHHVDQDVIRNDSHIYKTFQN